MSVFDVDMDVLVTQLLPVRLRLPKMIAWLKSLAEPVKWVYNLFKTNRDNNLYALAHDGQVCYLEDVLNDTFDNTDRRIFISDPAYLDPVYIYEVIESKEVPVDLISEIGTSVISLPDPLPLYLNAEVYAGAGNSFIVNVPLALGLTLGPINRLKALVDLYKLPGRRYDIAFF